MFGHVPIAALLMTSAAVIEIAPLEGERFSVSIVFAGSSPSVHAEAQIALMNAAAKQCKGEGRAMSEETLYIEGAEPDSRGRKRLKLTEVYSCAAKTK